MTVQESDKKPSFQYRRDTAAVDKQLEYVLDMLLSKDLGEVLIATEKKIDPTKMHHMYTRRLLDLQAQFNEYETGLGTSVAKKINDNMESLGYITALSLIDYLIDKNVQKLPETAIALPEVVASIKGKNGTDSRMLRYDFIERILPRIGSRNAYALEGLARAYMRKYDKPTKPGASEENLIWRSVCISDYGGDFEAMKRDAVAKMRSTLEPLIRKINAIEGAEKAGNFSNSDYKDT